MSGAQRRIGSYTRGAKQQLLIDRTVTQESKIRHTNLCTAWIDDKKVFNSIPHTWILEHLELCNINRTLRVFIMNSMKLWKTALVAKQVNIKCNIYQGDASPLFCTSSTWTTAVCQDWVRHWREKQITEIILYGLGTYSVIIGAWIRPTGIPFGAWRRFTSHPKGGFFGCLVKCLQDLKRSPVALIQALMITTTWMTENLHHHITYSVFCSKGKTKFTVITV